MKKRFFSALLSVLLLFTVLPISPASAANTASAKGADIVNYAKQYIGKVPYVWGGKTIDGSNPGADCSGFICRIYEHFGFNLWSHRTQLRKCGTNLGTDLSKAQLGDIIWFTGHVAIYAGKDSRGNHTIVHETGGSFQNVVQTKISVVNAELKGIIRIPGVTNGDTPVTPTTPNVQFTTATSEYQKKASITDTNAEVVTQIKKDSGISVSSMGLYLYNANGTLLKKYSENVSNVTASQTSYHSWFNINSELGITLTPGTTYQYAFFGVFDGVEVVGSKSSFTTTGTAPVTQYTVYYLVPDNDWTDYTLQASVSQVAGDEVNVMPEIPSRSGYTAVGWFSTKDGGTQLKYGDLYTFGKDTSWYARYTKNAETTTTDTETHKITYMDLTTMRSYGTYSLKTKEHYVLPDETPTRSGYTFAGWYTTGGTDGSDGVKITENSVVLLVSGADQILYAKWIKDDTSSDDKTITLSIGSPYLYINGVKDTIDSQGTVPVIRNNRTLMPVRAVIEAMGGDVEWLDSARTVILTLGGKTLYLPIGSSYAFDGDNKQYSLDSAPVILNNRTMLPIRFVVEYFDGTVDWNNNTKTVTVEYTK